MASTVPERVANGVAWLDATTPDWAERIILTDFDIENPCRCVLGQVFANQGGYSGGLAKTGFDVEDLDSSVNWTIEHGFDAPGAGRLEWFAIQREWKRAIKARRLALV